MHDCMQGFILGDAQQYIVTYNIIYQLLKAKLAIPMLDLITFKSRLVVLVILRLILPYTISKVCCTIKALYVFFIYMSSGFISDANLYITINSWVQYSQSCIYLGSIFLSTSFITHNVTIYRITMSSQEALNAAIYMLMYTEILKK